MRLVCRTKWLDFEFWIEQLTTTRMGLIKNTTKFELINLQSWLGALCVFDLNLNTKNMGKSNTVALAFTLKLSSYIPIILPVWKAFGLLTLGTTLLPAYGGIAQQDQLISSTLDCGKRCSKVLIESNSGKELCALFMVKVAAPCWRNKPVPNYASATRINMSCTWRSGSGKFNLQWN